MSNLATITNNILADSGIDDLNVVVTTGSYANPAWITSLAWSKITGAPLGDYLPLAGGTMTGNINWAQTDRGITWNFNTDGAYIKFYNTGDGDTDSRLEFATIDNNNEYFRWGHVPSGGSFYESMKLVPNSSGNAQLIVSGSVGIGTTSPSYVFHAVSSNTTIGAFRNSGAANGQLLVGNTAGDLALRILASGDAIMFSDVSKYLAFGTNGGSERMRISSAGAIKFNTYGSGTNTGTVAYNLAVDASGNVIETAGGVVDGSGTANYIPKWSDPNTLTNSLIYDNGTNVAIGTTSPINTGLTVQTSGAAFSTTATKNSNMYGLTLVSTTNENTMSGVWFGSGGGVHWSGIAGSRSNYTVDWSTHLSFYTHIANTVNITEATEKMRITGDGNVGIGATNPDSKVVSNYGTLTSFNNNDIRTTTALLLTASDPGTTSSSNGVTLAFRPIINRGAAATITVLNDSVNKEGSGVMIFSNGGGVYPSSVTEAMRISNSQNILIGIGTDAGYRLDVAGTVRVQSSFNGLGYGSFGRTVDGTYRLIIQGVGTSSSNYGLSVTDSGGNQNLWVRDDGVVYLRGNVGIGTSSPSYKLQSNASSYQLALINPGYGGWLYNVGTDLSMGFVLEGTGEKMRLTSSGDLLIGDTTASANLWVKSSASGNAFGARNTNATFAATVGFFGADRNTSNNTFYYIDCYNYGNSTYRFRVADSGNVTSAGSATFAGTFFGGNNIELVNAGGPYILVGEGTGASQYGVVDWDATNNRLRIATQPYAFGANSGQITLTTAGNVGIGTLSPATKLEVRSNVAGLEAARFSDSNYADLAIGFPTAGVASIDFEYGAAGALAFRSGTGKNERMRITSGGFVGIGESSPISKLTVTDSNQFVARFYNSSANQLTTVQVANQAQSTAGVNTAAATFELVGKAGSSTHGRHAWIGAEGVAAETFRTKLLFKLRGESNSGYTWAGVTEAPTILTLDGNGLVGIVTSSPASFLQIGTYASASKYIDSSTLPTTPSGYLITLTPPSTTGYYGGGIGWSEGTNTAASINVYDDGAGGALGMVFATGSNSSLSENMRITSGGNIGIGTSSPSFKLDVNGTTRFQGIVRFKVDAWNLSDDGFNRFYFASGGRTYFGSGNGYEWRNNSDSSIMTLTNVGVLSVNPSAVLGRVNIGYNFYIENDQSPEITSFVNSSGSSIFRWMQGITPSERMRLNPQGNLGIGTSAPGYKLEVNGGSVGNNIARFTTGSAGGGTRGMNIYSNDSYVKLQVTDNAGSASTWAHLVLNPDAGYVGIGTTSPSYSLDVNGAARFLSFGIVQASGNADVPNITFTNNGGAYTWGIVGALLQGDGDGALYFKTKIGGSVTEKMRIASNGNVAIGTTSVNAAALLHLSSSASETTLLLENTGTGGDRWMIRSTNNSSGCCGSSGNSNLTFYDDSTGVSPLVLQRGGSVGIGTLSPTTKLHVYDSTQDRFNIRISSTIANNVNKYMGIGFSGEESNTKGAIFFQSLGQSYSRGKMIFALNNVSDQSSATPSNAVVTLDVTSSYAMSVAGTIYATGDVIAYSDASVKTNIRPIENVLSRISDSRGVLYDRTDRDDKDNIGFIAQELEKQFPELVSTSTDGTKGVKYQNAVAVLFEAIKEQQKQIDELKKRQA